MPSISKALPRKFRPIAKIVQRLEVKCLDFDPANYSGGHGSNFSSQALLLYTSLQCAVPLWVFELQGRSWEYIVERASCCAQEVAERGDLLMFRGKKPGQTAAVFNRLAEGVACLSFCPGGITVFGVHYEQKRVRVDLGYKKAAP